MGREDPLEKEMAIHCSFLAGETPWTEEPGGLQSMELQESDTTQQLNHHQQTTINKPILERETLFSVISRNVFFYLIIQTFIFYYLGAGGHIVQFVGPKIPGQG